MCSIFGIGFLNGNRVDQLKKETIKNIIDGLFREGEFYGKHAAGISVNTNRNFKVIKNDVPGSVFIETEDYKRVVEKYIYPSIFEKDSGEYLISIIGHCRWETQGPHENNDNNHPIMTDKVVGVHNGHIHNDHELFEHFKNNFKRIAQVDSEIIFQLVNHFTINNKRRRVSEAIQDTARLLSGSFACSLVNALNPHILWVFKSYAPTHILLFPKIGIVMFATSKTMIKESIQGADLGKKERIKYEDNTGIGIDLFRNKMKVFDIDYISKRRFKSAGFVG